MSNAAVVARLIRDFGETVRLERDGAALGTGRAILRPMLDREDQFRPSRLGIRREEEVLCLAETRLPFPAVPDRVVLRQGGTAYEVISVRTVTVGREAVYQRAVLHRRDEEEIV